MESASYKTALAQRMINRADFDQLPDDHEMRIKASEFENTSIKYFNGEVTPQQFLGAFARARICWCNYSGETLV